MLFWEFFKKLIFSRRANSLIRRIAKITVIGMALSLTSFLLVLFIMNAMNEKTKQRVVSMEPHLVIHRGDGLPIAEDDPIWEKIKQSPNAVGFPFESQDIILRSLDGQIHGAIAQGLDEKSFLHLLGSLDRLNAQNKKSKVISSSTSNLITDDVIYKKTENYILPKDDEIIIGIDLSRSLGLYEEDRLMLIAPEALLLPPSESPPYKRVKVLRTITTDLPDIDSKVIYYKRGSLNNSQSMAQTVKYGVEVFFENPDEASDFKNQWIRPDLILETWKERNSDLFQALLMEKFMIGIILTLAALIAGSAMITVMSLLISQKRMDIAILKTLGLSDRKSEKTFVRIGFLLGMVGVVLGVALGTGGAYYLQKYPLNILPPEIYYDSQIEALVDLRLVVIVLVVALLLSYLGAYISTRDISNIQPSEALRGKR